MVVARHPYSIFFEWNKILIIRKKNYNIRCLHMYPTEDYFCHCLPCCNSAEECSHQILTRNAIKSELNPAYIHLWYYPEPCTLNQLMTVPEPIREQQWEITSCFFKNFDFLTFLPAPLKFLQFSFALLLGNPTRSFHWLLSVSVHIWHLPCVKPLQWDLALLCRAMKLHAVPCKPTSRGLTKSFSHPWLWIHSLRVDPVPYCRMGLALGDSRKVTTCSGLQYGCLLLTLHGNQIVCIS